MATDNFSGADGDIQGVGGAVGGFALTDNSTFKAIPTRARDMTLTTRNYAGGAVIVNLRLCPWIAILKTQNAGVTVTNYSDDCQVGASNSDLNLSSQGTAAQGDFLYVGSHVPFGGVYVDMNAFNGNASVLTVKYYRDDGTWADISVTDDTDVAGDALALDGYISWSIPTDWVKTSLVGSGDTLTHPLCGNKFYWTRWEYSAALSADVTIHSMAAISGRQAAELIAGQTYSSGVSFGPHGFAGFELWANTGTANVVPVFGSRGNF